MDMKQWLKRGAVGLLSVTLLSSSAWAGNWPQFLGQPDAQGFSDGQSATTGADLSLRWEKQNGSSWYDVPGTPIVVGDYVYYYGSQYLRKVELSTGKEVNKVQVYGDQVNQFFINIAYGDGKIFVPCQTNNMNDGTGVNGCFFRVYDANTLQQLYVTESIAKGQMQSPVMYHDGHFVTGTYGRNGVYAGFTSEDEDPTRSDEVKKAAWLTESGTKYGFSFNGAAFHDKYCYFGQGSTLYVVDYKTGEQRTFDIGEGYINHSTVVYNSEMNRLYVTATNPAGGASIFSYALTADGMPDAASALEWASGTQGGGSQSTPVIYNGRLYIGGGGSTMGSNEPFHVVDAATMKEIYSVPILTKGSAGVSTAYATAANGHQVYIYMIPYAPKDEKTSQMWIIKDHQGQTKADYEVVDNIGTRQYCSQSVIVADDGSLLWYNDAGRLYCYENAAQQLENGVFRDTKSHWAKSYIQTLASQQILNGTGNNQFSPDATITRAQFVQILAKLSGQDFADLKTEAFSDVKTTDWFAPAVTWATQNGVASGTSATTFSPNAPITRQDMAVMLNRYLDKIAKAELTANTQPLTFTDAASIAGYAKDAVTTMQTGGIISGMADGAGYRFAPTAQATRAQAAVMIAKLSEALSK